MALGLRQTEDVLRILEEDMVVRTRSVEVEEGDIEPAQIGSLQIRETMRCGQIEVSSTAWSTVTLRCEKDRDTGYKQCLWQTLHDGVEQGAQIGLRVDAAAKFDQRLAVVKTLLIEGAVNPRLNRPFQRFEGNAGDDNGRQQTPETKLGGETAVYDLTGYRHDAEVNADQQGRRERVGDTT